VPSLRHPMVNAAAIATLVSIAGESRVVVAIGSGFTGRLTMGQRPMKWTAVREYVKVLRALLKGEDAQWEGGTLRMLHPEGYGAHRPIKVPIIIGAAGPKGIAAAQELGDGIFAAPNPISGFKWSIALTFGTVLGDGEDPGAKRVLDAAGHAAPVIFHFAMENKRLEMIERGQEWAKAYEKVPANLRHLALHDQHLIAVNERDRPFVTGDMLAKNGLALSKSGWRERFAALEEMGATEIAYQPAGPDIASELKAFASAFHG
jgi:5,10-methylenetetrahydromethanopterin reductase